MPEIISERLIRSAQPRGKPYDIRDSRLSGLILRVLPSGRKVYYCQYARGKRRMIGRADVLTPTQARIEAKDILAKAAKGENVKRKQTNPTLSAFLTDEYGPWVKAHRNTGQETLERIEANFPNLLSERMGAISIAAIEQWRTRRLDSNIKPATINRDVACLKAALAKAVEWQAIDSHPLAKLKPLKDRRTGVVRYLTNDEEAALRGALAARDQRIKAGRASGNEWREKRGHDLLPDMSSQVYGDHLSPMVLLILNTGLRRGEAFSLTWDNVDTDKHLLTVSGHVAKSGKPRHVPLNQEAIDVLEVWRDQTPAAGLIFPGKNGGRLDNVNSAWRSVLKSAGIENFRFHDTRHTFASKLVMRGVDLYVVKELLGHATIEMTERYAHLAPEHKAAAVAKLMGPQ